MASKLLKYIYREIPTRILLYSARGIKKVRRARGANDPLTLVLLICRSHDIDLYLDIYRYSTKFPGIKILFWVRRKALEEFPATSMLMKKHGMNVDFVVGHRNLKEAINRFSEVDALLNTVEYSIARHKMAYRLVRLANAAGVVTYTMQQGFENAGLTYIEPEWGPNVTFAAQKVLTWGSVENLPGKLAHDTRKKCVAVGYPKGYLQVSGRKNRRETEKPVIAVFEGLHAKRFDSNYRKHFFQDLQYLADTNKDYRFIIKPHPGVKKRSTEHETFLKTLRNVEVADPLKMGKEKNWITPELLEIAHAVITTPSTIALDAAMSMTPAAVVRYDQPVQYYDLYTPLPFLDKRNDWIDFLRNISSNYDEMLKVTEKFLTKIIIPGNTAERILTTVMNDCGKLCGG